MTNYHQFAGTFRIGGELTVNRLGYGCMQLTGQGVWGDAPDRDNAISILRATVESGVNFIDTADSYGPHTNETLIADALFPYPEDLLIATKGGFDRTGPNQWRVNGNPEHIRQAIDGSLKRLKKDVIDLWQLHRIDSRFPVEETLGPVLDAVNAGKIPLCRAIRSRHRANQTGRKDRPDRFGAKPLQPGKPAVGRCLGLYRRARYGFHSLVPACLWSGKVEA